MFSIGNNELKKAKQLGNFILCDICGQRHRITTFTGDKISIQTYKCGEKRYLVGMNSKDIRKK